MSASKKVYIIGSKGIPAKYGGFETFIEQLVSGRKAKIEYVVTGMSESYKQYIYKGARSVQFATGTSTVARMFHTMKALLFVVNDSKSDKDFKVVYILGCRAGVFLPFFRPILKKRGVSIFVNPDGAEWKRAKWNRFAKAIVLLFEWMLVKNADMVISDSMAIKEIMKTDFRVPENKLAFAAYGSEIYEQPSKISQKLKSNYMEWTSKHGILDKPYFLMVGRFVPENNYELVIREFMASSLDAYLVIISNVSDGKLKKMLYEKHKVNQDPRIKLVGTLYDQELLKFVRSEAIANIHGHEVGGTNPSLLEALGSTKINIVYDVSFNREVVQDAGMYFTSVIGSLGNTMQNALRLSAIGRNNLGAAAKLRIKNHYSWPTIIDDYERLFLK